MCELASAGQRRHVDDLPAFGTVGEWQGSGRVAAGERHGNCVVNEALGCRKYYIMLTNVVLQATSRTKRVPVGTLTHRTQNVNA
jgi:hypothetical protein